MDQNILLFTILSLTFVTALSQLFLLILTSNKKSHFSDYRLSDGVNDGFEEKSQAVLHDAAGLGLFRAIDGLDQQS